MLILSLDIFVLRFQESGQESPITFKQFCCLFKKANPPQDCVETVDKSLFGTCITPVEEDEKLLYCMPSLEDLGIVADGEHVWKGGETEALKRLEFLLNEVSSTSCILLCNHLRQTNQPPDVFDKPEM